MMTQITPVRTSRRDSAGIPGAGARAKPASAIDEILIFFVYSEAR